MSKEPYIGEQPELNGDILKHYGTPRHSGRYPWGSGDNPYQRNADFLGRVYKMRKEGVSNTDIAKSMNMNTTQLRAKISIATSDNWKMNSARAWKLKEKGYTNVKIGQMMGGVRESTVRDWLNPHMAERFNKANATADMLEKEVEKLKYVDVGEGVEQHLNITPTKLKIALAMLEEKGYGVYPIKIRQQGTGKNTTVKVLMKNDPAKMDPEHNNKEMWREAYQHAGEVKMPGYYTNDLGNTFEATRTLMEKPKSVDSKRIFVRYTEDDGTGGKEKDGLIEIRRGLQDLSLGKNHYAQVRIGVDDTHYMKGMCVYSDNIPDGYDVVYNSKYPRGTSKDKVFKLMQDDPETNNPFGASVHQLKYTDADGKEHKSLIYGVNEEGDWASWSKNLPSQFLSKQPLPLIKRQLDLAYDIRKDNFDEIKSLTNPVVKKELLESFATDCDSAAVHLKAASMPRQQTHALIPIPSLAENEIFAPNYRDGERVVLVRFPHEGTYQIPELVVNNKNADAKSMITNNAKDAVGIHPKAAEKLSGADFDGDSVLVIPNNDHSVKWEKALEGLRNFDPSEAYPAYEGMPHMTDRQKGTEMGKASNLITDMTLIGATSDELARATRYSMTVIDAKKHYLNYKQAYIDNGIAELQRKYQGKVGGGAATLISKSTAETHVPHRKEKVPNKETGEKVYEYTGKTYFKPEFEKDKAGNKVKDPETGKWKVKRWKEQPVLMTSTQMAEKKDAFELSSGTAKEAAYAEYANKLKAMANEARKEYYATPNLKMNPSAKAAYSQEVADLNEKLRVAKMNAPLERRAQAIANEIVKAKIANNPELADDHDALKKIKGRALEEGRFRAGAGKIRVEITDREWEAIQAGAISANKLSYILKNADMEKVKRRALPRTERVMSTAKIARAKTFINQGRTRAEIADILGVSVSTIDRALES